MIYLFLLFYLFVEYIGSSVLKQKENSRKSYKPNSVRLFEINEAVISLGDHSPSSNLPSY